MFPEKLLLFSFNTIRLLRLLIHCGNSPFNWLLSNWTETKLLICPSSFGKEPLILLWLRLKNSNVFKPPIQSEIFPEIELLLKSKFFKFVRFCNSVGIITDIWFPLILNSSRLIRLPNEAGIWPVKLFAIK